MKTKKYILEYLFQNIFVIFWNNYYDFEIYFVTLWIACSENMYHLLIYESYFRLLIPDYYHFPRH